MTDITALSFAQKSRRLSPMYAAYFTLFGVFTPYLARYLTAQGLTPQQIGVIVATVFGVNVFAPFLFTLISDRTGQRLPLIRIGYVLCGLMWASTWLIPKETRLRAEDRTASKGLENAFIDWPQVVILMAVVFLWQLGLAPYNTFFDLFLKDRGFSATTIGFLISFGSICEIVVFLFIASWFQRFSERLLIVFALGITVVRWVLLANLEQSFALALLIQGMHALTFGVVHSVAIHRVGRLFPPSRQGFGQGLYVSMGMGVGLICGNLIAGWLWQGTGIVYWFAAAMALVATLLAYYGFKPIRSQG